MAPVVFPPWDNVKPVEGQPHGNLWGFFDKDGKKDELGTLNLLTPELVNEAKKEIQTGERVQLDWGLDKVTYPAFNRKEFEHKLIDLEPPLKLVANDEEIALNPQSGSQWDGFKHVAHQHSRLYYNGLSHGEVHSGKCHLRNGVQNWVHSGGIAGRGVLIDWASWYEAKNGKPADAVSKHEVPVSEIEEVAKFQGTELKQGDILLVRFGFVKWHDDPRRTEDELRTATQKRGTFIGVKAEDAAVRWLYDHHFAAVAGDTVAFEAWPPNLPDGVLLHEWLLTHWGTPIGEMWDLEGLAKVTAKLKRYSFFLTSAPLHIPGGVGSTPQAIAIF